MIKEEVLKYLEDRFTGISSDYEGIRRRYENHVKTEHAQPLIEEISTHLSINSKILDIGSGWGSFVYLLRSKGYEAYGIEIQDFMVDYARQRIDPSKHLELNPETIFLKASALDLPFSDSHFDVVTLWDVLEHIEDYERTLLEAYRVLKPGGRLFIKNVNYASCFVEPHYRVLWLPFLPKKIAIEYLKLLGRNPTYIREGIFYISNSNVLKILKKKDMYITNSKIERISSNAPEIQSSIKRLIYQFVVFLRIKFFLVSLLKAFQSNPFSSYIDIMAVKQ